MPIIDIISSQKITAVPAAVTVSDAGSGTFNATRLQVANTAPGITGGRVFIEEGVTSEYARIISVTNGTQFIVEELVNTYTTSALVTFLGFTNAGDPQAQTLVKNAVNLRLNGSKNKAEVFSNIYALDLKSLWNWIPNFAIDKADGKMTSSEVEIKTNAVTAGDRGLKMWLTATLWVRFAWNNTLGKFQLLDQNSNLKQLQVADPGAGKDAANRDYVDTQIQARALPKRHFYSGPPKRTGNTTLSVTDVECWDETGVFLISKTGTMNFDRTTVGAGGLMGSTASAGMPGTITVTNGSSTVNGVGTAFNDPLLGFVSGDLIVTNGGNIRIVDTITSATQLTTTTTFSAGETGVAYARNTASVSGTCVQNLYIVSNGIPADTTLCASTRNYQKGDQIVDLPRVAKTGTVQVTASSNVVNGTGTLFLSQFPIGSVIQVNGQARVVQSVASDIQLSVTEDFTQNAVGQTPFLYFKYFRQMPFAIPYNASTNIVDFSVSGWPLMPHVTFRDYDGSNFYRFVAGQNNTAAASVSLWSRKAPLMCPEIAGRVDIQTVATKLGSVPANPSIAIGISATNMFIVGTSQEFTTTGPTFNYIQGYNFLPFDLSSSGNLFYKVFDVNILITVYARGYYVTEWK